MPGQLMKLLLAFAFIAGLTNAASAQVEHRISSEATQEKLRTIISGNQRPARHKARDQYRHPVETLTFFGIEPEMTVVEIYPGGPGGWYRRIIEPLIGDEGTYIPVERSDHPPAAGANLVHVEGLQFGDVDLVLVFRAHGFVHPSWPGGPKPYLDAIYRMLKPGGLFGIVDHAGDENVPQDPRGVSGYVNESYFFTAAKQAGFHILAASDVNRNPKDTKDHPAGVYSIRPVLSAESKENGQPIRRWKQGSDEYAKYSAIGESDRFTHLYYKPYEMPQRGN